MTDLAPVPELGNEPSPHIENEPPPHFGNEPPPHFIGHYPWLHGQQAAQ